MKVRSILEMAVPVWQPNLTKGESNLIEHVQKSALRIIIFRFQINWVIVQTLGKIKFIISA